MKDDVICKITSQSDPAHRPLPPADTSWSADKETTVLRVM